MSDAIKATVREYTVKKKVVVVEIPLEVAEKLLNPSVFQIHLGLVAQAIEAALADKAREDSEDVPF